MASTTEFAIVTPSEIKVEGKAEIVIAPGSAGDLGVLPSHAPLLTTLRVGVVRATLAGEGGGGSRRVEYAVDGGFMQVLPHRVVVLTDIALAANDIDPMQVRAELRRAEEALAAKRGGDDSPERHAVAWANARLSVAHVPA